MSTLYSTRLVAVECELHMVASADNPLLFFLPERANGHETGLWAMQAECSMLAFCIAWDRRERVGGVFRSSGQ